MIKETVDLEIYNDHIWVHSISDQTLSDQVEIYYQSDEFGTKAFIEYNPIDQDNVKSFYVAFKAISPLDATKPLASLVIEMPPEKE